VKTRPFITTELSLTKMESMLLMTNSFLGDAGNIFPNNVRSK
jgi:hypothetical protein